MTLFMVDKLWKKWACCLNLPKRSNSTKHKANQEGASWWILANTILGKIVERKKEEFAERLKQRSYADLEELARAATPARGFAQALHRQTPCGDCGN